MWVFQWVTLIGLLSIQKGLEKLLVNTDKINYDLNQNWAVVASHSNNFAQEGYPNPYEVLKDLTRINSVVDQKAFTVLSMDSRLRLL